MLYWSIQQCLQLYSRKYPHSKDFSFLEKVSEGLAVTGLFFSRAMSFKAEGQLWQKRREGPDVLSLFRNWKKSKVRNLKRLSLRGESFSSHLSSVSSSAPLFLSLLCMVCDLSVRRVTWVLLMGLTPTDRRLTLERSVQARRRTPAT